MKKHPIFIKTYSTAKEGYRVLAAWDRPSKDLNGTRVDLWVPELAPSMSLMREYRKGRLEWEQAAVRYACELRAPFILDAIKPIALLTSRMRVVLLCGCGSRRRCFCRILEDALLECRKSGRFVLTDEHSGYWGGKQGGEFHEHH